MVSQLDSLIAQHYFSHAVQQAVDDMEAFTLRREWVNTGDYYFYTPGEGTELVAAYTSEAGALGKMLAALEADARCLGMALSWEPASGGGQWRAALSWASQWKGTPTAYHAESAQAGAALGRALLQAFGVTVQEQER